MAKKLSTREKMTKKLKREAPETLSKPKKNQFDTASNFGKATKAFKKYNNWASDDGVTKGQAKKKGARHESFPNKTATIKIAKKKK